MVNKKSSITQTFRAGIKKNIISEKGRLRPSQEKGFHKLTCHYKEYGKENDINVDTANGEIRNLTQTGSKPGLPLSTPYNL